MSIHITGIGIISAIGNNVASHFKSLQQGKSGIEKSDAYPHFVGNVKLSDRELIDILNVQNPHISRTSLLGQWAVKEAWGNNSLHPKIRTGLVASTSVGGMDKTEKFFLESFPNSPPISLQSYES